MQKNRCLHRLPPVFPKSLNFLQISSRLIATSHYGFTARTVTAVALGLILLGGLWQLHETLTVVSTPAWVSQPLSRIGIPAIFAGLFGWIIFRLVNYPIFAEFLIATEAEMNKVSWTTWNDLKRATTVVLVVVVLMTTYLWVVDQVWSTLLTWIGVLRIS